MGCVCVCKEILWHVLCMTWLLYVIFSLCCSKQRQAFKKRKKHIGDWWHGGTFDRVCLCVCSHHLTTMCYKVVAQICFLMCHSHIHKQKWIACNQSCYCYWKCYWNLFNASAAFVTIKRTEAWKSLNSDLCKHYEFYRRIWRRDLWMRSVMVNECLHFGVFVKWKTKDIHTG